MHKITYEKGKAKCPSCGKEECVARRLTGVSSDSYGFQELNYYSPWCGRCSNCGTLFETSIVWDIKNSHG